MTPAAPVAMVASVETIYPLGHLAHGRNSDFVGMIQQERGSHLELRTQFGEARPDQGGELVETVGHAMDRANGR